MSDRTPPPAEDVRSDLEAAFEAAEKPAPREPRERRERDVSRETAAERPTRSAAAEEPVDKTEEEETDSKLVPPEGDRPRDQFGRFLSKTPEARAEAEEPTPAEDEDTDQPEPKADEPEKDAPAIAPPQAWSGAVKDHWAQLPRAVREEILKRESDVAKGLQQRAEQINALEPIARAVQPYAQKFALRGESPAATVQQLLAVQDLLERDPIEGVAYVARSYGVDLRQFAAALAQAQQSQNPEVQAVNARLERMEAEIRQRQHAERAAEGARIAADEARITSEIEAFRADTTAHPYFDAVHQEMVRLFKGGIVDSLQDAYDRACWSIPDIRARILTDQKRAEQTQRSKAERDASERARRAAVSVNSAPVSGRGAPKGPGKSIREDLEAAFERVASS